MERQHQSSILTFTKKTDLELSDEASSDSDLDDLDVEARSGRRGVRVRVESSHYLTNSE